MTVCNICGEKIEEGSRTCSVCGSSVDEFLPTQTSAMRPPSEARPITPVPKGGKSCPSCGAVYGSEYTDAFCACGTGLVAAGEVERVSKLAEEPVVQLQEEVPIAVVEEAPPLAPILPDEPPPLAAILEDPPAPEVNAPDVKVRGTKPSSGTPCLVLYGPDKQPLQYFSLTKDAMLIGRLDAVAGNFPDIDLDEWFDRATIRRISRQHALILRSRATGTFVLRPLVGNTGTQLEAQMLSPQQDYPLTPGHRIVLGGVIRLKFEIA